VTEEVRGERWLEVVSTVLLALASVATAWSAYQARVWTGEQALGTSHATAARIAVNRNSAIASRQLQIDIATFIQWVNAHEEHRTGLADFYRARFRTSSSLPSPPGWRQGRSRIRLRRQRRSQCRSTA
jgi:hypothetical protein